MDHLSDDEQRLLRLLGRLMEGDGPGRLQLTDEPCNVKIAGNVTGGAHRKFAAIQRALKTTTMPSLLGGSYAPDDHNHAHTSLQILGLRDGHAVVIATE